MAWVVLKMHDCRASRLKLSFYCAVLVLNETNYKLKANFFNFSVAKATLQSQMSVRLSVCLSVCPSVTETPQNPVYLLLSLSLYLSDLRSLWSMKFLFSQIFDLLNVESTLESQMLVRQLSIAYCPLSLSASLCFATIMPISFLIFFRDF